MCLFVCVIDVHIFWVAVVLLLLLIAYSEYEHTHVLQCVETAATMVAYGYRHCGEILVEKDQKANISIGGLEAVMEKENDRGRVERKPLPISKMRSWRVGVLVSN